MVYSIETLEDLEKITYREFSKLVNNQEEVSFALPTTEYLNSLATRNLNALLRASKSADEAMNLEMYGSAIKEHPWIKVFYYLPPLMSCIIFNELGKRHLRKKIYSFFEEMRGKIKTYVKEGYDPYREIPNLF